MIARLKRRRVRKTAKRVSKALHSQYGNKAYYTGDEMSFVCLQLHLGEAETVDAYGMFAEEAACDGFLSKIDYAGTATELRKAISSLMFRDDPVPDDDDSSNRFHVSDDELDSSKSTAGAGGGWFSGGDEDGGSDSGFDSDCGGD